MTNSNQNSSDEFAALSPLITRCPNCTTRFKVTEPQLQAAHGKVRCGACLSVFEATASLTQDGEPFTFDAQADLDDLLEEIESQPELGDTSPQPMPPSAAPPAKPITPESEANEAEVTEAGAIEAELNEAEAPAEPDELAALEAQLLAELQGEVLPPTAATDQSIESEEALNEVDDQPVPTESLDSSSVKDTTSSTARLEGEDALGDESQGDESQGDERQDDERQDEERLDKEGLDLEAIGDELDEATDQTAEERQASPLDGAGHEDEAADIDGATGALHTLQDSPQIGELEVQDESQSLEFDTESKSELVAENDDAAIVTGESESESAEVPGQQDPQDSVSAYLFDVPEEPPKPKRPLFTIALIVLALLVLPAQVLWFQYDTWVKDAAYRPMYAKICSVLGCELPPMKDATQIVSRKSISRAHPEKADVRIVDVLMVNNAPFPQPFPLIELTFTNVDGQLVAGRRFQPADYLHGKMRNVELMQPRTPVHISLELQDPGPTAQGFRVVFR